MGAIYLIQSQTSGKVYVGQTVTAMYDRWRHHVKDSRKDNRCHFHSAINKYGAKDFLLYALEECTTPEELNVAEARWISLLRACERTHGYNTSPGGNTSPAKLPEVRAKIAATLRGRKAPEQQREKMRQAQTGRIHSEESKRKASVAQKGKKLTEEHKANVRQGIASNPRNPDSYSWTEVRHQHMKEILHRDVCKRGHQRTPENVYASGNCKLCTKELRDKFPSNIKRKATRS